MFSRNLFTGSGAKHSGKTYENAYNYLHSYTRFSYNAVSAMPAYFAASFTLL